MIFHHKDIAVNNLISSSFNQKGVEVLLLQVVFNVLFYLNIFLKIYLKNAFIRVQRHIYKQK